MGLETGTYVQDLVETNPVGATDERRFGDDHLRLIKSVLKTTLPDGNQPLRFLRYENRTADTVLGTGDKAKFITVSSVFNQTFSSPGVLGNGWWCVYRNVAAEPHFLVTAINGLSSPFKLYPGEEVMLFSTGSDILGVFLNDRVLIETKGPTFSGAVAEFIGLGSSDNRFESYDLEWENLAPVSAGVELWIQVTINNGASWVTSASYDWVRTTGDGVSVASLAGYGSTRLTLCADNAAGGMSHGRAWVKLTPVGLVRWQAENSPNNAVLAVISGWGRFSPANGIRLLFSSGNIQDGVGGAVRLYGKRART